MKYALLLVLTVCAALSFKTMNDTLRARQGLPPETLGLGSFVPHRPNPVRSAMDEQKTRHRDEWTAELDEPGYMLKVAGARLRDIRSRWPALTVEDRAWLEVYDEWQDDEAVYWAYRRSMGKGWATTLKGNR